MEHLVQELIAGGTLVIQNFALAQACIYKQTEGERQIVFLRKITNCLWQGVRAEREVILGEVIAHVVVLIADSSENIDHIYFYGNVGGNRSGRLRRGLQSGSW